MKEIKIHEIPNIDFIERIDDPYIGMIFYVADIDTYYSVKTLKEINGINMKGSKVVEYVIDEYADFGTGSGGGSGLTATQLSNIAKIPAIKSTVDALPNNYASKDHNHSEYASSSHRHDASEINNLPSGGGGSGEGLTSTQKQQLQTAYNHSQSTHVQSSDIPTKVSELENDSNFATVSQMNSAIDNIVISGGGSSINYNTILDSATNLEGISYNAKPIRPLISFIDDDGKAGVYTKWKPILEAKNIPMSMCIITGSIGNNGFMTWEQVKELQNSYNCEILSHSVTHKNINQHETNDTWIEELKTSKTTLLNNGIKVRGFAYPNGGFYGTKEGLVDGTLNGHWMTSLYYDYGVITDGLMNTHPLTKGNFGISRCGILAYDSNGYTTLNEIKAKIDECKTNNSWLILMTHIDDVQTTSEDVNMLSDIIDYIKSVGIDIVTISEGFDLFGNIIETPNCTITKQGETSINVSASVPNATTASYGIVKIGNGISVNDGIISIDPTKYYSKDYIDEVITQIQNDIIELQNNSGGSVTSGPVVSNIESVTTTPGTEFTINYTATDDSGIFKHEISLDNGSTYNDITPTNNGNGSFSYTTSIDEEATNYCKLRITNNSGKSTIKSFVVVTQYTKIKLSASVENNGVVVDKENGIFSLTNTVGKFDSVILFDGDSKLENNRSYVLYYELLESNIEDTTKIGVGNTWNVTHSPNTFNEIKNATIGTPIEIPFTVYDVLPDSKNNKLLFIQFSNTFETEGAYIKFKVYIKG